jgi:hypothetical protein
MQGAWDVVLAADLWYERFGAGRATAWLRECAARGARVLIADVGRAYAPRAGLEWLQHVEVADPHVEPDHVGLLPPREPDGLVGRGGLAADPRGGVLEQAGQSVPHHVVVVGDQHLDRHGVVTIGDSTQRSRS